MREPDHRGDAALLEVAVHAAWAAGELLLRLSDDPHDVAEKTSATDPVSEADRASEELLSGLLAEARPDDGLLGEEGAQRTARSGLRWVLDPLDGTVNYLYGLGAWAVSVACERVGPQGWTPAVGAVADPLRGELFAAQAGRGATVRRPDGAAPPRALRVNDPVPLDRAPVATGFSYDARHRAEQAAVVARLLPRVRDVRRIGSAALDLCGVAAGRLDAYYEDSTSRWDWAAAVLIAREAGAGLQRLEGPAGSGWVAAGPALLPALTALVTEGRAG